jgi:hypothetical protein
MEKMNYPKGLIRYSTENALSKRGGWSEILRHVARPRMLVCQRRLRNRQAFSGVR